MPHEGIYHVHTLDKNNPDGITSPYLYTMNYSEANDYNDPPFLAANTKHRRIIGVVNNEDDKDDDDTENEDEGDNKDIIDDDYDRNENCDECEYNGTKL